MMGRFELEKTSSLDTWSIFDTHGAGLRGHRAEAIELRDLLLREFPVESAPPVPADKERYGTLPTTDWPDPSRVREALDCPFDRTRSEQRTIDDAARAYLRLREQPAWVDPLTTVPKDDLCPTCKVRWVTCRCALTPDEQRQVREQPAPQDDGHRFEVEPGAQACKHCGDEAGSHPEITEVAGRLAWEHEMEARGKAVPPLHPASEENARRVREVASRLADLERRAAVHKQPAPTWVCEKVPHEQRGGYLHGEDDDSPYDVDGLSYCGRCHHALDPGESHRAPGRFV